LLYRDKVYDIIDSDLTPDQKDYKLSQLKPSDIYTRLMNEMYPKLRRNDYKIVYEVRNFDLEEARVLLDENPKKLSVDEIYKVAGSYEKGSEEYNHALEAAAQQYPEVVAAAVNAANLAVAEGDYEGALDILKRSNQSDARIQAAEGYIYIHMQDYDKAREVLTKAADAGNEDAQHNLAELERYLGSL
jgi:tetratricopeptide (TPR) repeat protein